ncbi:MAG: hypothetical protein ACTHKL_23100 [Streptosporangiaceae bacterium]
MTRADARVTWRFQRRFRLNQRDFSAGLDAELACPALPGDQRRGRHLAAECVPPRHSAERIKRPY